MKGISARSVLDSAAFSLLPGAPAPVPGYSVAASAAVRPGVTLNAQEAAASALRGGRGVAATLDGGFITAVKEGPAQAAAAQRALSFFVRAREPSGTWEGALLCEKDPEGRIRFALSAGSGSLLFELFTDYREKPMRLEVPLAAIGALGWHDIVGRYAGAHVGLFVDGVVVDEDWPIGALPGGRRAQLSIGGEAGRSAGFKGQLDAVAVWDRALSDAEIEALCGGAEQVAARGWALPEPGTGVQYRGAPGGAFVGDCLPFFHDGTYHFYYLFDRRNHRSKFGLGAHQWAHASSTDLVHWKHHPLAIPITEEREGSICTGSMFFHDGTWYGFYATRLPDRSEHLSLATSTDGIHFTKTEPNPFASPKPPYRHGPFRDPTVFRDPKTGTFHMLVTAELEHPAVERRGGCLAHLVSTDLRHWEQKEPFLVTGYADQPECSELFSWRGWYYLVFSHFGVAHYRISRDPFGPWQKPAVDMLDGPQYRVMKSAAFTGDRRIGAFFLDLGKGYAGYAVFRELLPRADGTLGTRWVPEMVPATGAPVAPVFAALGAGATGGAGTVHLAAAQGFAAAALGGVPVDMILRCRVTPTAGTHCFGIGVRGRESFKDALNLELEPGRKKAGWRSARNAHWSECETAALYQVDDLDKPFSLEVLTYGEVLDVCIDNRRTLIHREATSDGDRLFFYCQEGEVRFEKIEVRPLLKPL